MTEVEPRINVWWHLKKAGVSRYFAATVAVLGISLYLSFRTCSWTWMARAGGPVALFGALLGFPRLLRLGPSRAAQSDGPLLIHGNQVSMEGLHQAVQALTDSYALALGVAFVTLGTVLAGYGDVIFELLWPLTTGCSR